ncbi:hypothetical protein BSG1_15785 [Bacillus sp. SG-1]|nr:hypothetical protein BSG1_15785 [Bacillus sp. SG-1]
MVSPVIKSGGALFSPDRQMFLSEKKGAFLLFAEGYLTPRGWALELDVPLIPQEVTHLPLQSPYTQN